MQLATAAIGIAAAQLSSSSQEVRRVLGSISVLACCRLAIAMHARNHADGPGATPKSGAASPIPAAMLVRAARHNASSDTKAIGIRTRWSDTKRERERKLCLAEQYRRPDDTMNDDAPEVCTPSRVKRGSDAIASSAARCDLFSVGGTAAGDSASTSITGSAGEQHHLRRLHGPSLHSKVRKVSAVAFVPQQLQP